MGELRAVRKLIHVALAVVPLIGWFVSYPLALALSGILALGCLVLELARRHWAWIDRSLWHYVPGLFRPSEPHQVLGSTWYCVAMLAVLLLFGREVGGMALLFLALGDPAAELAGRRWGRRPSGKTLAGSLACLLACLAAAAAGCLLVDLAPVVALAGALAATLAERWPLPPSDNVWMPLFSALTMAAVRQLTMGGSWHPL